MQDSTLQNVKTKINWKWGDDAETHKKTRTKGITPTIANCLNGKALITAQECDWG